MLWNWPSARNLTLWDELDRLQGEMNRLFEPVRRGYADFPAVNIWTGPDSALLTAELPGVDPGKIEVTVKNDTITIRGSREAEELKPGETLLRQERGAGNFVRSFALPFHVDGQKVTADYRLGVLQVTLPRLDADKPKRITVKAG